MPAPDLSHIDTWLFDLDNTLYPLECGLAARVDARLTDFVVELTGLPRAEAFALQKQYLEDHGLTLIGLMKHHDVEPEGFNALFHDLPLDDLHDRCASLGLKSRGSDTRLFVLNK